MRRVKKLLGVAIMGIVASFAVSATSYAKGSDTMMPDVMPVAQIEEQIVENITENYRKFDGVR